VIDDINDDINNNANNHDIVDNNNHNIEIEEVTNLEENNTANHDQANGKDVNNDNIDDNDGNNNNIDEKDIDKSAVTPENDADEVQLPNEQSPNPTNQSNPEPYVSRRSGRIIRVFDKESAYLDIYGTNNYSSDRNIPGGLYLRYLDDNLREQLSDNMYYSSSYFQEDIDEIHLNIPTFSEAITSLDTREQYQLYIEALQ